MSKNKIPTPNELRERLDRVLVTHPQAPSLPFQTVKSVLREEGIELEPDTQGKRVVSCGVQRSWCMLWGKDGNALRPISVDRNGFLQVRNRRFDTARNIITNQVVAAGQATLDFGEQIDYVEIGVTGGLGCITFSGDGVGYVGQMFSDTVLYDGVNIYSFLKVDYRCRYVRWNEVLAVGGGTVYGSGFVW